MIKISVISPDKKTYEHIVSEYESMSNGVMLLSIEGKKTFLENYKVSEVVDMNENLEQINS